MGFYSFEMRVYFAHPCFTEEQRAFKSRFLQCLLPSIEGFGIDIVDPFEYTPIFEERVDEELAREIKTRDLELLESCDVILAVVDFSDTGVAFEVGYSHAQGKKIILISTGDSSVANAMLLGAADFRIDSVFDPHCMEKLVNILKSLSVEKST